MTGGATMIFRVELRPREGLDPAVYYAEAGSLEVLRTMGVEVVSVTNAL